MRVLGSPESRVAGDGQKSGKSSPSAIRPVDDERTCLRALWKLPRVGTRFSDCELRRSDERGVLAELIRENPVWAKVCSPRKSDLRPSLRAGHAGRGTPPRAEGRPPPAHNTPFVSGHETDAQQRNKRQTQREHAWNQEQREYAEPADEPRCVCGSPAPRQCSEAVEGTSGCGYPHQDVDKNQPR